MHRSIGQSAAERVTGLIEENRPAGGGERVCRGHAGNAATDDCCALRWRHIRSLGLLIPLVRCGHDPGQLVRDMPLQEADWYGTFLQVTGQITVEPGQVFIVGPKIYKIDTE